MLIKIIISIILLLDSSLNTGVLKFLNTSVKSVFIFLIYINQVICYAADPVILTDHREEYDLGTHLEYLEDNKKIYNIHNITTSGISALFQRGNDEILNFGYSESDYWLKFSIINTAKNLKKNWLLEIESAIIDTVEIYIFKSDGTLRKIIKNGLFYHYETREIKRHTFAYYVDIEPGMKEDIYIKAVSKDTKRFPLYIYSEKEFYKNAIRNDFSWGIYIGICLIMILYNLFIYASIREKSYFYYVIFTASCLLSLLAADGYAIYIFHKFTIFNIVCNLLFISVAIISASRFGKYFLNIKKLSKTMFNLYYIIEGLGLGVGIFAIIAINYYDYYFIANVFTAITVSFCTLLMIVFGLYALFKRVRAARFYMIAWSLFLMGVLCLSLRDTAILPSNIYTDNAAKLASALEILLLSLGLADRINTERREKAVAKNLLIQTLKNNEDVIRGQNIILEYKVAERTELLEAANHQLISINEEINITLEQVDTERHKSDKLLLNILPKLVANELKETGNATPQYYESVTVIFADFVDFTKYAENQPPHEIVEKLNRFFQLFDEICQRNNLEKIKTIGDCYMAAGGLPLANSTNAIDTVKAAIEMIEAVKNSGWELRIGINTGPVVAGVIGKHKFAYDIWGDTVNVAARMEIGSLSNKINISSETYELVKDIYKCTYRGKILAKNKGEIDMYFVEI